MQTWHSIRFRNENSRRLPGDPPPPAGTHHLSVTPSGKLVARDVAVREHFGEVVKAHTVQA